MPGEPGNQPLYVEAPDGQVRAGSPYSCRNSGGCDGVMTCVGGKRAGDPCDDANDCQGGVCVGVNKLVINTGIDAAKESIQKIFAKSMGIWGFDNHPVKGNVCGARDATDSVDNPKKGTICEEDDYCNFSLGGICGNICEDGPSDGKECPDGIDPGDYCYECVPAPPVSSYCNTPAPLTDCSSGPGECGICTADICIDGPNAGASCSADPSECVKYYDGVCNLGQIIGYENYYDDSGEDSWDITHDLAGTNTKPPTVSIVDVTPKSGKGAVGVKLTFHAWADDNHMPLKKITIDWGDGQSIVSGGPGSYYQNRKPECADRCDAPEEEWDGLICSNADKGEDDCSVVCSLGRVNYAPADVPCEISGFEVCKVATNKSSCEKDYSGVCRRHFGDSDEACEDKPFEFSHVYGCAAGGGTLDDCQASGKTYNCYDANMKQCVYKPKVQVLDNWGWCNGTCDSRSGEGCYDASERDGTDECSEEAYPHWTEFGGNIIVEP